MPGNPLRREPGLNVDAGVFVSYIGLFQPTTTSTTGLNQPSFVSSQHPLGFFFQRTARSVFFQTKNLKNRTLAHNGLASYANSNRQSPGFGRTDL